MKTIVKAALFLTLAVAASSCGNTIRGMGQDTASAINATQDAGHKIDRAASK